MQLREMLTIVGVSLAGHMAGERRSLHARLYRTGSIWYSVLPNIKWTHVRRQAAEHW